MRRFPQTVRLCALVFLLAGALALRAGDACALPVHDEHHPRLLFDADGLPNLLDDIWADPERFAILEANNVNVAGMIVEPADSLLDYWWGFSEIQELAIAAQLAPALLDSVAAAALERTTLRLAEIADPDPGLELGTLGSAIRLQGLALGYDNAFAAAPDSVRQIMIDEILLYLDYIPNNPNFQYFLYNPLVSNKGASIAASLILGALAIEPELPGDPILADARLFADELLAKAVADMFCRDGSYREGAGYAAWALRTLLPAREALLRLEGSQSWDGAEADRRLEWFAYQLLPELAGGYLNRNDHNTANFLISRHHSFIEWMTLRGSDPGLARWLLRRTSGDMGYNWGREGDPIATLLWHRSGSESPPTSLNAGRFFPDRGFFVYRRGWPGDSVEDSFLLTLEGGRFMGGHAQEDVGQFTLRALGHGFALDHGAGLMAKQTESHNLVLADGIGQHNAGSSIGTDGTTELLLESNFCTVLRVDMTDAYTTHSPFNDADVPWSGWSWSWGYDGGNPMESALRTLLLFHGDPDEIPVVWLEDDLLKLDDEEHDFEWRMHIDDSLTVAQLDAASWEVAGDGGRLHMRLHDSDDEDWVMSLAPYDNGGDDPNSQVFALAREEEHFTALLQLSPLRNAEAAPACSTTNWPEGLRAVSERGGRERRILRRREEEPLVTDSERLDGAWGVLDYEGQLARTLLIEGRHLVADGSSLIGLEPSGSAAYDGEAVRLSAPDLQFKIWAPNATAVFAGDLLVPFERRGDFVVGPPLDTNDLPEASVTGDVPLIDGPWPNPGRGPFLLTARGLGKSATLEVFDISGRLQRRLNAVSRSGDGGERSFIWDGRNDRSEAVASGIYLLRLRGQAGSVQRKLLLLR